MAKQRAPRNRTLTLRDDERPALELRLRRTRRPSSLADLENRVLHQTLEAAVPNLPPESVDVLFLDPPYNLSKRFATRQFRQGSSQQYRDYLAAWLPMLLPLLKPTGSVYLCGDWRSAAAAQLILEEHLILRNRITWEREKGRGAKTNWKNCAEDIWFATASEDYTFNVEAVKLKRRVMAPYKHGGRPKDWDATDAGNFRLTHPSNLWTDISVPFWSMPENTDHPTQKPEKLLAKLILASTHPGDLVLDPFGGSGSTAVAAQKLGRRFILIEPELEYCLWAVKRLEIARHQPEIQGYYDGVFWERNSSPQRQAKASKTAATRGTTRPEVVDQHS